jgi:hypothetical protein
VSSFAYAQQAPREPHTYFREHAGLKDDEIRDIDSGKVVAKEVNTGDKSEVVLFGAVYIHAPMESFVDWFRDPDRFAEMEDAYLAYGRFSDPPQLSDVANLTLDKKDIEALPKCKPGHCDLQLPTESMEEFKRGVDWSSPDAAEQVNALMREGLLELVNRYKKGGNAELGVYQDKDYDLAVAETFETILSRVAGLSQYLPDLRNYLMEYPTATLSNVEESFRWEHVKFGLRPTLRATHVIVYRPPERSDARYVLVDKQLYASHYFQVAVDFWFGVKDSANPEADGFYLITEKGSRQHGLTGFKGKFARGPIVGRARDSLKEALAAIKQELEAK